MSLDQGDAPEEEIEKYHHAATGAGDVATLALEIARIEGVELLASYFVDELQCDETIKALLDNFIAAMKERVVSNSDLELIFPESKEGG